MNDIYRFDPVKFEWEDLTAVIVGSAPSPRARMGFTSFRGMLFVHGGEDKTGTGLYR